ncbi:MAG: 1-acyl-sn-glycerol-3-phosphate acyltransferase [Clostridia bacterium]|nr:1-acyl-sn-glycerol-3-phosphate acyltransferase [Clostridia bacterium]
MKNKAISIFIAYDKDSLKEIIATIDKVKLCDPENTEIHILHKGILDAEREKIASSSDLVCVFDDVGELIPMDGTEYYKFAIERLTSSPRAIYINPLRAYEINVNELFACELGEYYVGAYHDTSFDSEPLSSYTERVLGISHYVYANDDCAVINVAKIKGAYDKFKMFFEFAKFSINAPEALFNLTFKDRILVIGNVDSKTSFDGVAEEIDSENSFLNKWNSEKRAKDRTEVINKIAEFEKNGIFDQDVEDDVPGRMIMPDEIEYIKKKPLDKLKASIAFNMAKRFYYKLEKKKMVMINDEVDGLENLANLDTGAVITCNHFNAMDSFAMHWVYLKSKQKKRKLYRVIREGNYTSFPGFFGFLMRNFYTLPLSSNHKTMKKFMTATNELLQTGHFVLVYPEQSMWWNYRKPKPLKPGAFSFAAKNGVPVLPIFISMRDSNVLGPDGFFVQEYKMHIGKPIYPDTEKGARENIDIMLKENERVWQEMYEREYQMPLEYITEKQSEE